jgi:hypothetical protein
VCSQKKLGILFSLLIHCGVLLIPLFYKSCDFNKLKRIDAPLNRKLERKLRVELRKNAPSFKKKLIKNKTFKKKSLKKSLSLKDLSLLSVATSRISRVGKFGEKIEGKDSLNVSGRNNFRKLYQYIGERLRYPRVLRDEGIEGQVLIRFVMNKDGVYLKKLTKIKSNSNYLKVHLSRLLKKIFQTPFKLNKKVFNSRYLIIDMSFTFDNETNFTEEEIRSHNFINSGMFMFLVQDGHMTKVKEMKSDKFQLRLDIGFDQIGKMLNKPLIKREILLDQYKRDPSWSE